MKYRYNRQNRKVTERDTGRVLYYFPPIRNLSGEVILVDKDRAQVVWQREQLTDDESSGGIWNWSDLLYEERLDHFFEIKL